MAKNTHDRTSERGNVFFTLFGAVAVVGVLGAGIMGVMRGPLSTMVEVNRRTQAEAEMNIASKLVLLEAVNNLANDGDCDADNFVEPLEFKTGTGPTNGGVLPDTVASNKEDPWGTLYGYCAWDAGPTTGDAGCDSSTAPVGIERLAGANSNTELVIAVVSAGSDRTFQTTCNAGATPTATKTAGSDDLITTYTYTEAASNTGGLWNIKSGEVGTAQISKDLEVEGGATFTDGITLSGTDSATQALRLGAASLFLPRDTDATAPTCAAANVGILRINTGNDPDTVEVCDDASDAGTGPYAWENVAAGGDVGKWEDDGPGGPTEIYYNAGLVGIGTNDPDEALDVSGNIGLSGALQMTNGQSVVWTSTAAITEASGAIEVNAGGGAAELDIDTALITMAVDTIIQGSTTGVTTVDALTVEDSNGADILVVQNDGNVGIGTNAPSEALNVVGNIDLTGGNVMLDATQSVIWASGANIAEGTGSLDINANGGSGTELTVANNLITMAVDTIIQGSTTGVTTVDALTVEDSNGADILVVQNDGNVGIGVANPDVALDVDGDAEITGSLDAGADVTAAGDVTASGNVEGTDIIASNEVYVLTDKRLGPPDSCAAAEKLEWSNLSGWDCVADLGAGSGGGGAQDLEDVLSQGTDAGGLNAIDLGGIAIGSETLSTGGDQDLDLDVTGHIGATSYCNADGDDCFTSGDVTGGTSSIFEVTGTAGSEVVRTKDANAPYATSDFVFGSAQLDNDAGGTDDDARMFFDKSKAAFRAGTVSDDRWDTANLGDYSIALGQDTRATGSRSVALGFGAWASGSNAFSIGADSRAGGNSSFAAGISTLTTGANSIAMGQEVTTNGANSFALGLGDSSTATFPQVSGSSSFGIFMGDQNGINVSANNVLALMGGTMVINDVATNTGGEEDLDLDVEGSIGAINYCDEAGDDCFQAADVGTGIWTPDGTNNYIEYDDALGGARIASVTGQPAPASDWTLNVTNSIIYTNTNTVSIGGTSTSTGGEEDLDLDVTGSIGAINYCDADGDDCFQAIDIANGGIFERNGTVIRPNTNIVAHLTDDFVFGSSQLNADAGTDYDSRFFFDKDLGAFRAGTADASQWDTGSLGDESIALGNNVIASGAQSIALGQVSSATGNQAFAVGNNATASGLRSLAMGTNVTVSDSYSAAFGLGLSSATIPTLSGKNSFAVFMGDQQNVTVGQDNTVAFLGGRMILDAATPATETVATTGNDQDLVLDVEGAIGAIHYCDEDGFNCTAAGSLGGADELNDLNDAVADYTTDHNIFIGDSAGAAIIAGGQNNLFIGEDAGNATTTGDANVALGRNALLTNTTANNNIAIGVNALYANDTGVNNTAVGHNSLFDNNTGLHNTAIGYSALSENTDGGHNTAVGYNAGSGASGASSERNVFLGTQSGVAVTTARNNVFVGYQSGASITEGDGNILIGYGVDAQSATTNDHMNIGNTIYANLSSGNVGIGVPSPNYDLHVNDDTGGSVIQVSGAGSSLGSAYLFLEVNNGTDDRASGTIYYDSNGDTQWFSGRPYTNGFGTSDVFTINRNAGVGASLLSGGILDGSSNPTGAVNFFLIDNTGDVGIGDVSPDGTLKLDVEGQIGATEYCDEDGNNCFTAAGGAGIFEVTGGAGSEVVSTRDASAPYATADFVFGSAQLDNDGGGTDDDARMFFDKSKGAFRAGRVNSAQWDNASVGNNSFASGANTTASGGWSTATGADTEATGSVSTAFGNETIAAGQHSLAIGLGNSTSGKPQVSAADSMAIFMGDQSAYDLSDSNKLALIGGEFVIDEDGSSAASKGCIRFNDTTDKLQFSHDCSTYIDAGAASADAIALDDLSDAYTDYTTDHNIFIGDTAGASIEAGGQNNIFIGSASGNANTTGSRNVFIGKNTGLANTTATEGAFIGYNAGAANTTGGQNAFFGFNAGAANTEGIQNTALGRRAGQGNTTGDDNIFIGNRAGQSMTTEDENIIIGSLAAQMQQE